MANSDFDFLNDLPKFEAGMSFEEKLNDQIEMPSQKNVVRFGRWVAPIAMAASLAFGLVIGNSAGFLDNVSITSASDTGINEATTIADLADSYATTFSDF